jgi:hypothetical protein
MNASFFLKMIKYITYSLLFLFIIGAIEEKPSYFILFVFYIKMGLAFFLLYRFNPFFKQVHNDFDRKIVYTSAIFILISSFLEYINRFVDELRHYVMVYTDPLLKKIKTS